MARMLPEIIFDTGSQAEVEIFNSLKNHLSNSYTIFHSLRWIGSERSRAQGEADFVVFHPKKGILVIEVKGGLISYKERVWYQTNRRTLETKGIFDPEKQADESRYKLIEILYGTNCMVCHAVWFPSVNFAKKDLPPNYHPKMLFNKEDLSDPENALIGAFNYWKIQLGRSTNLNSFEEKQVLQKIAPNFSLVPSLHLEFQERDLKFIQLTKEQSKILDFLELQKKAAIAGSAGTGKTLIAIEKARQLASSGAKVLFLCYNRLLADYLNDIYSHYNFTITTFDSLSIKYVGKHETFGKNRVMFLDFLLDMANEFPFTDIVVDEGQDFPDEWIEYLEYRVQNGHFYVFYDQNQCIYLDHISKWLLESPCRLTLTTNCRNTVAIAKTSYGSLGKGLRQPNLSGIEGEKAELISIAPSDLSRLFNKKINQIIQDYKIELKEIAILSMTSMENSCLKGIIHDLKFPVTETYDNKAAFMTTAKKFKGLEASFVFITDIDWDNMNNRNYRNLFYTTCSRARHKLFLISPALEEINYNTVLNHIQDPESKRKGKRRFLNLFNLKEQ